MKSQKRFTLIEGLVLAAIFIILALVALSNSSCGFDTSSPAPVASSGIQKATASVVPQASGLTIEQENIKARLLEDNKPGSIKHLYVISAYSGQVLIYSTVKGKVTSGGKRLTPTSVVVGAAGEYKRGGFPVAFGGNDLVTDEVLQDDGSYGTSDPYLYWWDVKGIYHQHYVSGGQILHISNQPLPVKSVIINMEMAN